MLGHAYDLAVTNTGILKNLPVCIAEGKPVSYMFSREEVWKRQARVAVAHKDRYGNPVVYVDPIAFSEAPAEFQVWVLEHECNHHAKGHLSAFASMQVYAARERESDMVATQKVVQAGFTPEQLHRIYNMIKDKSFHEKHLSPLMKAALKLNPGHLDGEFDKRSRYFLQCVDRMKGRPSRRFGPFGYGYGYGYG